MKVKRNESASDHTVHPVQNSNLHSVENSRQDQRMGDTVRKEDALGNLMAKILKSLETSSIKAVTSKKCEAKRPDDLFRPPRREVTQPGSKQRDRLSQQCEEHKLTMCTTNLPLKLKPTHQPPYNHSLVQILRLIGPDNRVQSRAVKLDGLIKKNVRKRVMIPEDLIAFIRSSGAISKYQTDFQSFRNPVFLELGSHLLLSSLSSDALDEALAVVLRDLSVEIVKLLSAAAVPSYLDRVKEILNKAKNEENSRELRVDVSFISGTGTSVTKVRLVGYRENVNKLKEVLHDYQINQIPTQEVLILPHPEMADCFDEILDLTGMKQTKVTLRASHSPHPCVLVSGPCCHVQEAKQALTSSLANLTSDTLILDGGQALHFFQTEGKVAKELVESSNQVLIREKKGNMRTRSQYSNSHRVLRHSFLGWSQTLWKNNRINLKIGLGSLVDEQVDVLVVPMLKKMLTSTEIGKCLLNKAGNAMRSNFNLMAAKCTPAAGDVLQVDAPTSLSCSKVFFIECLPWDGIRGLSVQALGNGLKKCLDLCLQQGWSSVALPLSGPDGALKYPYRNASQVLVDRICQVGSSASSGSLSTIHIIIKPDPGAENWYHDVYSHLNVNMNQGGQAIFGSLTSDLDDFTVTVGGRVKLQVVFGDITNETTDAVVNSTTDGVCKDILSKAGPQVEGILKMANVNQGVVFKTPPGSFPCKAILHVCGERNKGIIELLVYNIIQRCEASGYKSVAIPAICAGAGGLDPGLVAHAILQGIKTSISSRPHLCLTSIRLVLIKINVFLAFKHQAMQMFAPAEINKVSDLRLPPVTQQPSVSSVSTYTGLNIFPPSSTSQRSAFLFLGLCRENVDDAMTKLKNLYQSHCSTKTFTKEDLADLNQSDMKELKQMVETQGLYMQVDHPNMGDLTVRGLKDGVSKVVQILETKALLRRERRVWEEDELYTRVSWCILGSDHSWKRLPKTASHNLENSNVMKGIVDAEGISWSVDLQKMEAKSLLTRQRTQLKRLENRPDFSLPLYWDNMAPGEKLKVVALHPSSPDYSKISMAFKQTVNKSILKIERVQNIRLLQIYEAQKKHISEKDIHGRGAGEKLLYHGTSKDNCDSIINNGFNRSFSGRNANAYGHGTYFAVNASYSAHTTYATPAADGSQTMFVAQVLTGTYTQGNGNMRVPPPRNSQKLHDLYDSVVDQTHNPSIYVIFSDNQAYPAYLITFC
ncbi:protein mono-ADP-ribosyltransferase PARP14-like [Mugil cephalus]|uniref:protein mono-ADP-ribosyltransferase PARP14-like n=1 Tax=Mugil cephalus TaxID=48193 RepID=UPI001FB7D385|nr:protein mono-ADP-ribosyltransferase PARP14-like [Mugil cephalus]